MSESLLNFPALYPIKVMGQNSPRFTKDIKNILQKAHQGTAPLEFELIDSKNSNYVSIRADIYIKSHADLHAMYQLLNAHPMTKMIL